MDSKKWKDLLNSGNKLVNEAIDDKVKKLKGKDVVFNAPDMWKLGELGYVYDKDIKNKVGDTNPKTNKISIRTASGDKKAGTVSVDILYAAIKKSKDKNKINY